MTHNDDPDELIDDPLPRMPRSVDAVYITQQATILELRKRIAESEAERDSLRAQVGRLTEALSDAIDAIENHDAMERDSGCTTLFSTEIDRAKSALTPDVAALGAAWKAMMEEHEALGVARNRSVCNCNACMMWKTAEAALRKAGLK